MVRKKQQHPYHGTKEHIDTMENTTPLVANFLKLPQRTLPPLLRFAIIMKQSNDPEGTKNKILEEGMEYELTQVSSLFAKKNLFLFVHVVHLT